MRRKIQLAFKREGRATDAGVSRFIAEEPHSNLGKNKLQRNSGDQHYD